MTHFVYIPVTGVGLYGGYRGDAWFKERIEVFKNYTLKSLKAQTNQDFIVWMSFRPQDWNNLQLHHIETALQLAGLKYVFTFEGLMYHDDKFGGSLAHKLRNVARVIRGCYRNRTWGDLIPNTLELLQDKNKTLVARLSRALPSLKPYVNGDVLLTRIDSDDMFHKDAITGIQHLAVDHPKAEAVTMFNGYIYNTTTDEVAEYNPTTNPPFHTIIFAADVFLNPMGHFNSYRGYQSHEDVPYLFKFVALGRSFCVVTHNPQNHISTGFNHPFRGKLVDKEVLKDFGL